MKLLQIAVEIICLGLFLLSLGCQPAPPVLREVTRTLEQKIDHEADINDLHPDLLRAVIYVESRWNPKARSKKGANGLMQLMPATMRRLGINPAECDEHCNVEGGAVWLRWVIAEEKGNIERGLQRWNGGPKCVHRCPDAIAFSREVLRRFALKDFRTKIG